MSLEDFVVALARESGENEESLLKSAERVTAGMKQETKAVMQK
jgi:hypothetical protein